jgi:DinB family protein
MQRELIIKMVLDAWDTQIKRADDLFKELSDEQLMMEVSPGRNRGVYLLGHLAAVHDRIFRLLNNGDEINPGMYEVFVVSPDKSGVKIPPVSELRLYWKKVNSKLTEQFSKLSTEEWFHRHTSVSEEDFKKEPHRNKLNIIITRTNHLASHLGQLIFLKPKNQE